MTMIADILLVAGALGAGVYCFVLARRLAKFNDLEAGVGGAVAVLSAQVDDMTRTLKAAQQTAGKSAAKLEELTGRAEGVSKRLELMLAAMHDLPNPEKDADDAMAAAAAKSSEVENGLSDESLSGAFETDRNGQNNPKKKAKRKAKRKTGKETRPADAKKKRNPSKQDLDETATPIFTRHNTSLERAS